MALGQSYTDNMHAGETLGKFVSRTRSERGYGASVLAQLTGLTVAQIVDIESRGWIPEKASLELLDKALVIGPERLQRLLAASRAASSESGQHSAQPDLRQSSPPPAPLAPVDAAQVKASGAAPKKPQK